MAHRLYFSRYNARWFGRKAELLPPNDLAVKLMTLYIYMFFHGPSQTFLEGPKLARHRNGIETVPASLRNRHHVDKMPVRSYIKTKLFFSFKIAGMNARKLRDQLSDRSKCNIRSPDLSDSSYECLCKSS